jgi:hypothetical protein
MPKIGDNSVFKIRQVLDKICAVCYNYLFKIGLWITEQNSIIHRNYLSSLKTVLIEPFGAPCYGGSILLYVVALAKVSEATLRISANKAMSAIKQAVA